MEQAGIQVVNLDELTPLAEYRNGGFIIDAGMISAKDADAYTKPWAPDSKLVIEWRALTIVLIDGSQNVFVRKKISRQKPYHLLRYWKAARVWAGRKTRTGKARRQTSIDIISDGTVF